MRLTRMLMLLALFQPGCMVPWQFARTTAVEPAHYAVNIEHCRIEVQARKAAEKAWQEVAAGQPYCQDYAIGFKDGFADYVEYGGSGEPPSIPPRQYWKKDSPAGRQLALEWSAGFRHGAGVARRSGLRELIVVPLTGPGVSPGHGDAGEILAEPRHEAPPPTSPQPVLPNPRSFEPYLRPM